MMNLTYNNNCQNFWKVLFCFIPTLKREDVEIIIIIAEEKTLTIFF